MLCGIDEAGRGPIAGPLVMAGALLPQPVEGLADSKKLSEKRREALFEILKQHSVHHIAIFSASDIDTMGISACISQGLKAIMTHLDASEYLFDGNSTFGVSGLQTLVKADDKIEEVKAASILAKVTRDRIMIELDTIYPGYGFAGHKGYGTQAHVQAIQKLGYCAEHRKSFRLKALEPTLF